MCAHMVEFCSPWSQILHTNKHKFVKTAKFIVLKNSHYVGVFYMYGVMVCTLFSSII